MVDCSEKLRALREARKLTQLQVANRVGVSKTMISAYETASKAPSIEVLTRLSRLIIWFAWMLQRLLTCQLWTMIRLPWYRHSWEN